MHGFAVDENAGVRVLGCGKQDHSLAPRAAPIQPSAIAAAVPEGDRCRPNERGRRSVQRARDAAAMHTGEVGRISTQRRGPRAAPFGATRPSASNAAASRLREGVLA